MKTRKLQLAILAGTLCLAIQARASLYDITFNGVNASDVATAANGQLDVGGGIAIGGWLDVTEGANLGNYTLVVGSYSGNYGATLGTAFDYDDLVFPSSSPAFLDETGGLLWENKAGTIVFNMWYNGPTEVPILGGEGFYSEPGYGLWGWTDGVYVPQAYGTATLTTPEVRVVPAPIPESTTIIAGALLLLPFGRSMPRILRRRQTT